MSKWIYKEEVHILITSMNDKRRIEKEKKEENTVLEQSTE